MGFFFLLLYILYIYIHDYIFVLKQYKRKQLFRKETIRLCRSGPFVYRFLPNFSEREEDLRVDVDWIFVYLPDVLHFLCKKEKKKKQKWIGLCSQCLTVYPVKSNYRQRFGTHRQSTMDERSDRYVRRGWTRSYLIFMPSWHSFLNVTTDDNEATLPPHRKRKPNSLSRRCHDDEGIKSGKIKMAKFRTGELVIWADIKTKQTGTYTEYRSRNGCVCLSRFYEP